MKQNATLLFALFSLFTTSLLAQPNYEWGKKLGGMASDGGYSICTDNKGNVYSTGAFAGTADFDPSNSKYELNSSNSNCYVSKLDANGNFVWAITFDGTQGTYISSITNDSKGNIYIMGYFLGVVDFNPAQAKDTLISNGNVDIFICKLDEDANFIWVKHMGGKLNDYATGISIDNYGNIVTVGLFADTVDFNPGNSVDNLTSPSSSSSFICKLSPQGDYIWAKSIIGSNIPKDVSINSANNIISAGVYGGTIDFDPGNNTYNLSYSGQRDNYFLSLDSNGNFLWAKSIGGTQISELNSICLDKDDNIYSTGWFFDVCDFDPSSNSANLTALGNQDVFICKLDNSGNYVWAKNFGGTTAEVGFSIAIDKFNNVYSTGCFNSTIDFDPGSGTDIHTSFNGFDVFITKFNSSGNYIWGEQLGGNGTNDNGRGIAIGLKTAIFTTGFFSDNIDMDPSSNDDIVSSNGSMDAYVHKMIQCTEVNRSITVSTSDSYTSPSGKYTWTTSNTYKDTLEKYDGCDSIITINLTINTTKNTTLTISTCNDYISPSGKYVWTSSNTYKDTLISFAGCDSILTINLTINTDKSSTITVNSCTDYLSPSGKYLWTNNGTYKDTVLSKSGCDSFMTINLTITTLDLSVNMSGNTLTANMAGASYQWLDCNNTNNPIGNATNKIFTPNVNGSYSVKITLNGCSDTSTCYTITTASIESNTIKGVKIYPNPSSGLVFINTQEFLENAKIKVMDITGKLLLELNNQNGNDFTIDLSSLSSSIYIIEITEGDRKYLVKLYR